MTIKKTSLELNRPTAWSVEECHLCIALVLLFKMQLIQSGSRAYIPAGLNVGLM